MNRPNRSHPTLTPLTTLPPSPSYLHPSTSIPPTPSLLSRPSSQTRLRPARSAPTAVPTSRSSPALLHAPTDPPPKNKQRRPIRRDNKDAEDDWVTRTASSLALARLEEKGQGWLAKRGSSTSLAGEEGGDDGGGVSAGRGSNKCVQGLSRAQSRAQSRMQSRRGSFGGGAGEPVREVEVQGEEIRPDFVNAEDEEEEGEGEDIDEGEMRRVVMGRVGGWVDWAVGWMDFRGEGEGDEDGGGEEGECDGEGEGGERGKDGGVGVGKGGLDAVELERRLRKRQMKDDDDDDDEGESGSESMSVMSAAPEKAGVWSDAKWLLGVATRVAL